jgi:hypothetical protein
MAGDLNSWNPYESNVQANLKDGEFLSAAFALVAAGPPRLSHMGLTGDVGANATTLQQIAQPIGLVQNISVAHNRVFNRVWEVGSERSYFIAGRTVGQASMGRVLFHGWSLLRVLYGWYLDASPPYEVSQILPFAMGGQVGINQHNVKIPAGYENFFINLASDLFSQPLGLMFILKDSNEVGYGAFYLEQCYIPNHSLATDAQGLIVQESVAIQFERLTPINIPSSSLFDQALAGLGGIGSAIS